MSARVHSPRKAAGRRARGCRSLRYQSSFGYRISLCRSITTSMEAPLWKTGSNGKPYRNLEMAKVDRWRIELRESGKECRGSSGGEELLCECRGVSCNESEKSQSFGNGGDGNYRTNLRVQVLFAAYGNRSLYDVFNHSARPLPRATFVVERSVPHPENHQEKRGSKDDSCNYLVSFHMHTECSPNLRFFCVLPVTLDIMDVYIFRAAVTRAQTITKCNSILQ
jgi:hypothetical protein